MHTYIHTYMHANIYICTYINIFILTYAVIVTYYAIHVKSFTPTVIAGVYSSGLHILRAGIAGSRGLRIELVDRPVLRYRRSLTLHSY